MSARRVWAVAVLTGVALAALVLLLGALGSDYERAATGAPAQTQVVHVRSGESLSSLAARLAPEQSAAAVIAAIRELNGLEGVGLRPGQALVVPAYR
ncbi:hypothetical protein GOHSU_37_00160 [Gordonia hirsuta DSM 44140 = NBRC 16056]|uniref:LysM domain-containing protein n=1 Tax=Gordonia hirsuta DSM 44140 = NBRC 16056 TaxID=1121927 RepID=L7LB08_9ACTN|nr:LysM peptidoglycan-binding domain-containing protein [Gordonia hirsuta]GAC58320.1 hypothetical protein GOHSU_37_00160 [Gordonia hirsuta DSM 44140 = NBRC 16056]